MVEHLCNWLHSRAAQKLFMLMMINLPAQCTAGRLISPLCILIIVSPHSCKRTLQPNSKIRAVARETSGLICSCPFQTSLFPISAPYQFIRAIIQIAMGVNCHSMQCHSYLRISISHCHRYRDGSDIWGVCLIARPSFPQLQMWRLIDDMGRQRLCRGRRN